MVLEVVHIGLCYNITLKEFIKNELVPMYSKAKLWKKKQDKTCVIFSGYYLPN